MRQTRWANPGAAATRLTFNAGALRGVDVDGRALLVGMYCSKERFHRVDLRDAATGEVLDVAGRGDKEWWHDPAEHFTTFDWEGGRYVLHRLFRPNGYRVLRVTPTGFDQVPHAPDSIGVDDYVSLVAPAVLGGQPAILTCDHPVVKVRAWRDGDRVLRTWVVPEGWTCARLVSAGGRSFAWLAYDVPRETPPDDWWRVAAKHGHHLWDVASGRPVGPPLLVRGYRWGPWPLGRRLVALFKADWRDVQVWDLTRREPVGPGLGDLDVANPSVGLLHGRPALAATTGPTLRVWDVGTGRQVGATELPDTPIATTIGPGRTVWAITGTGYVGSLAVAAGDIHPSAVRRLGPPTGASP